MYQKSAHCRKVTLVCGLVLDQIMNEKQKKILDCNLLIDFTETLKNAIFSKKNYNKMRFTKRINIILKN